MENAKKNVPDIRFPGFTDPWEQRKLGDVADVTKLAGFEFTEHVVYSDTGNIIALRGLNVKNGQLVLDDVKYIDGSNLSKLSRSKLYANDIMFTYVGTVGEVAIINDNDRFYLAPNVSRIRVQSNDSPRFVSHYMRSEMFYRTIILPLIATSSQPALSMENIRKFVIDFPEKIDEQIKIAAFFDQIDNLITLHQCKYYWDHTGIFTYIITLGPAYFTATWEQRKLSDVADIIGGGTPSTDVPEYWDGDIDWYAPAEINDQIYVDHSERKITQLGLDKSSAKILPANKTLLFTSRAGIGKTAILQHDAATNQGFQSLVLNDDNNPYFVYTMTEMIKIKAEKVASGSTFAEISGKMLGKLEFMFPTYEEQVRIGDCFKHIDNIITLHQCKYYWDHTGIFMNKITLNPVCFTATWEQRKLRDLIVEYKETVDGDCTLPILTSSKTEGVVLQEDHFGSKQRHDITGYNILPRGYCTYRNRSDGVDFTFNINKCCDKGIISKFYPVFYGNNNNIHFISLVLNHSDEVVHEIGYTCIGTGQKVLSFNDLQKMNIRIPCLQEQDRISKLFESIDNTITLHQRNIFKRFYNHFWFI